MATDPKPETEEQVDRELDAAFDLLSTGKFAPCKDSPAQVPLEHDDADAKFAEMETRLALAEQNRALAAQERDAAVEARKKLENTLGEFLSRFAAVRQTQSAAFKEIEQLQAGRRELEKRAAELTQKLAETKEAEEAAVHARDAALGRVEMERTERFAISDELKRLQETAIGALEPLNAEHERSMQALLAEAGSLEREVTSTREEVTQHVAKLDEAAKRLHTLLDKTRSDISQRISVVLGAGQGTGEENGDTSAEAQSAQAVGT